jgi:hypothetical protein
MGMTTWTRRGSDEERQGAEEVTDLQVLLSGVVWVQLFLTEFRTGGGPTEWQMGAGALSERSSALLPETSGRSGMGVGCSPCY